MVGGPTLTNFQLRNNIACLADIQVQLAQKPATCRPTSSANNKLIYNQHLNQVYLE
jgi:hypothetical protein